MSTPPTFSQPRPLTGTLYTLSLLSSLTVASIGLSFLLGGPTAAYLTFGIPLSTPTSLLSSVSQDHTAATAFIAVIGVRDLTLAFMSLCATLLRDRRAVGLVCLGGLFATVGDSLVMAAYSRNPVWWIGCHVVTGVPLAGLCAVLLGGGSEGKLKR